MTNTPGTTGRVLHSAAARYYDLMVGFFLRGREGKFRERLADLARLRAGEAVLDVGCGTGSLALVAARRVGPTGSVHGIDASADMIARARAKAQRLGVDATFDEAVVERLPFPDARFDVVLSTLMLHHLPRAAREQCAREIRRVLKPGGRVLAADFTRGEKPQRGLLAHLHRHGTFDVGQIVALLEGAGLRVTESEALGVQNIHCVLAVAPPNA